MTTKSDELPQSCANCGMTIALFGQTWYHVEQAKATPNDSTSCLLFATPDTRIPTGQDNARKAAEEIDRRIAAIAPSERPAKIASIILSHFPAGVAVDARIRCREMTPERWEELQTALDRPTGPTEKEAEEVLQHCNTSGKEVVNGFIEQLMRENLELKQRLAAGGAVPTRADAPISGFIEDRKRAYGEATAEREARWANSPVVAQSAREAQVIAERLVMHHIGTDCLVTYRALANDIAAAISDSPAPVESEAWRPIETAPTEGNTVILVKHPGGVNRAVYLLRKDMWVSPDGAEGYEPTHWMPLTNAAPAPVDAEAMRLPWFRSALRDWSIVGMNHYIVTTSMYLGIEERWLYVAMTKGDNCIRAQHRDELRVWDELEAKATALESLEIGGAAEKEK